MSAAAEWYRQSYPTGPAHDPRCLEVIAAVQPLHNVPRTGLQRLDGGFRKVGIDGVEVRFRPGYSMATFDMAELTRLVVKAHQLYCRAELASKMNMLCLRVFPRKPTGSNWERHPNLADLRKLADGES